MPLSAFRSRTRWSASALACAALITAGLVVAPDNAKASGEMLSPSQLTALRSQMSTIGISPSIQSELITKIEAGSLPDSARESQAPVSAVTRVLDGQETLVETFADGSRRLTTTTDAGADDSVATFSSKSGCKSSGGWYTNCKISISDFFSDASFVVDYQTSSSGKAKVRDVRSARCANTIGGCSVSAAVKRSTQSSAGPAWAELAFHADVAHIGSGVSGAFGIRVSGSQVTLYG